MSFCGINLTENVALHSDGTRDYTYTIEKAIVPRGVILAMCAIDMTPDIEIENDFNNIHDLYVNWQGAILKELFTGTYTLGVRDCENTYLKSENFELYFFLDEDRAHLCYQVTAFPDTCDEDELFSFSWSVDDLDGIDAIA